MTDTTTRTRGKTAATAAATAVLTERVKLVKTLGDKLDNQCRVDATAAARAPKSTRRGRSGARTPPH